MDRWQYLIVLGACLLITAPLEVLRQGVYRQARRAAFAVLPVAAVFVVWDAVAIARTDVDLQPALRHRHRAARPTSPSRSCCSSS